MSPLHALVVLAAAFGGEPAGEVIDFSATYCGPCRTMTPIVARLEREGLPIRQVDIERDRELADRFHITKIPTFVLVINGEEATRIVGPTSEAELRRMCSRIPQAAPGVQLASNTTQTRDGVSQPLGTVTPENEKKQNGFIEAFNKLRGKGPTEVRGNDSSVPAAAPAPAATNDPMAASVRIRATINGQISLGSGTVVHSQPGQTLIVTCGHIFRNAKDSSKVEVDLFASGKSQTYLASIRDFDLEADVGLISIPTHSAVSSTPLAPPTLALAKAERVGCIGCSSGNDPTREQLTITAVNKYDGPDNIECTGTPVQGRSGGGLFNADNQLVGVCIAAVTDAPLGVYAHVFAVHKLLDRNNLAHLYQPAAPETTAPAGTTIADSTDAPPADFPAEFQAEPVAAETVALNESNSVATTEATGVEATDFAAMTSDVPAGDAEVVVIIKSPNGQSRVVIINRPSPKLMSYLNGDRPAPATQAATAPKSRSQLAATARGPQSVAAQAQPVSFPPQRTTVGQRGEDRSLSRRMAEARRMPTTAAK